MISPTTKVQPATEDHSDKNQPPQASPHDALKEFSDYTTLHGFHFLVESRHSRLRRLLWLVLVLLCLGFLLYQFVHNVLKLQAYEVILSRGAEELDRTTFPAVTLCNQNMMLKNKIMGTEAQRYLDQLEYELIKIIHKHEIENMTNERFDIERLVRAYGHNLTDMFGRYFPCKFQGRPCTEKDFSVSTSFMHGLCYTFNSGRHSAPLYVMSSGVSERLQLRLDAQPDEYYGPYSYESIGFKIAVHDQKYVPDMDSEGFDVSPGFLTNLRITKRKETYLPPPYKTRCGERKLEYYKKYSLQGCWTECVHQLLASRCGCRMLGMLPLKGISADSYPVAICRISSPVLAAKFCTVTEAVRCSARIIEFLHDHECDCPKSCEVIGYSAQVSVGHYPSKLAVYQDAQELNKTIQSLYDYAALSTNYRTRRAAVNIFYETLVTDVLEEKPEYTLSTFGAELGGNMGLFVGCSLLTVVEFIDLLIRLCIMRWNKWRVGPEREHR